MTSISHSAKQTFLRCPNEYYLKYVERLDGKETPKPLRMGSAFSVALEKWNAYEVNNWYNEFYEKHPKLAMLLHVEQATTEIMAEAYMHVYKKHEREIEIPEHVIGTLPFRGYIDGLIEPGVLVEDKLKSMWTQVDEDVLPLDDQVTGYIAMYSMMSGISPDDITMLYRVTKRPALRQRKTEEVGQFIERIRADVSGRPEHYFMEIPQRRSLKDIANWWEDTRKTARMIEAESCLPVEDAWPKNHTSCKRFNSLCPFWKICSAKDDIELESVLELDYIVRPDMETQ